MKITDTYVEFVTTTGVRTKIYKEDDPSLYFRMAVNSEERFSTSSSQEDYVVWQEDY